MTQTLTHGNMNWTMNMQHMNIYYSRCLYCFPLAFRLLRLHSKIEATQLMMINIVLRLLAFLCECCDAFVVHSYFIHCLCIPSTTVQGHQLLEFYICTHASHISCVLFVGFFLDILFESCVDGCYQCGFQ